MTASGDDEDQLDAEGRARVERKLRRPTREELDRASRSIPTRDVRHWVAPRDGGYHAVHPTGSTYTKPAPPPGPGAASPPTLPAMTMQDRWVPVPDDEAAEVLGEGIHTGLRKGTDAKSSHAAWKAIDADDSGWSEALAFALWGMDQMGYKLCKKEDS
jgi:hypothetical protein